LIGKIRDGDLVRVERGGNGLAGGVGGRFHRGGSGEDFRLESQRTSARCAARGEPGRGRIPATW
jgi:hypothetical protein